MKLFGAVAVFVHAKDILREPRFLDKLKSAFGGRPDLRTEHVRASIEATAIIEAARDALRRIGVSNAVSLVIDDTVLFHDRAGHPDDLGDLLLAFHDNESVFGQGFREIRLVVEHHDAGLHYVIELQGRSEHPRNAPAVRVLISGRIEALLPAPGEDAESYRKRAEPLGKDAKEIELYRRQHAAFVERVRDALAAAMPTARVEVEVAESRIVRPEPPRRRELAPPRHDRRTYDPYDAYYPNPLGGVLNHVLWGGLFSLFMPPHITIVGADNRFEGHADDPGIENGPTASDHALPSGDASWWDDDDAAAGPDVDEPERGSWWDDLDWGGGWRVWTFP